MSYLMAPSLFSVGLPTPERPRESARDIWITQCQFVWRLGLITQAYIIKLIKTLNPRLR